MKRLLVSLGALNVIWVVVSLGGVVLDAARLAFWSQHLMASLLVGVLLVPLLVFVGGARRPSGSSDASPRFVPPGADRASALPYTDASASLAGPDPETTASTSASAPALSWTRRIVYGASVLLGLWLFASLFGLFLDTGNLAFWTQSVMVAFIVTLVWTPLVVFFANPFDTPRPAERTPAEHSPVPSNATEVLDFLADREHTFVPPSESGVVDFEDEADAQAEADAQRSADAQTNAAAQPAPPAKTSPTRPPTVRLREEGDTWPEWPDES